MIFILTLMLVAAPPSEKLYGNVDVTGDVTVHDGDTIIVNIPEWPPLIGENIAVRLYGIDTPELSDKRQPIRAKAIYAKGTLAKLIQDADKITLVDLRRDKYFRICAVVMVDGKDVSKVLLEKKLAHPYFGETKIPW